MWYWELNPGLYVCWASALLLSCIYILNSVIFRRWSVIIMSLRPVWAPLWDVGFFVCLFFKITCKELPRDHMMLNQAKSLCFMKNVLWFLRNTEAQARMIHSFHFNPCTLGVRSIVCVSQALPFKAWMNLSRLPAFLSLWPCSQNELWICRHPAPQSQFWNYRTSENKFFHRFLPSDLSLCEAA